MIKGLGTDIIEICRIRNAIEKRSRFLKRFFNDNEIFVDEGNPNYYKHIAGRFAAKEAIVKSIGSGFRGFKWKDIIILRDKYGKPYTELKGEAKKISEAQGIIEFQLSISHSQNFAIATAIAISKKEG